MKKHIELIIEYYRGAALGVLLIMIIMTFAVYTFVNVMGLNEYIGYTKQVFMDSGLENALYFIPSKNEDYYMMSSDEQRTADMLIKEEILSSSGVAQLCVNRAITGMYGDKFVNIIFYDDVMLQRFKVTLNSGIWLDSIKDEKLLNKCIVGGNLFNNINIGSDIITDIRGIAVDFQVAGKMGYPAYIPQFLGGNSADDLFKPLDNVILMYYSDSVVDNFQSNGISVMEYENYFIVLNDDITSDEYSSVIQLLTKYGAFYTYDEIIKNTDETNAYKVKTKIPPPLYAFIISTISLLCISILITTKKLKEYSVYFLIGCSKRRSIAYITVALSLIVALPCGINILNILVNPYLFRDSMSSINQSNCYISAKMIIPIIIYMFISVSVSVMTATSVYMKYSPFEIHRRSE